MSKFGVSKSKEDQLEREFIRLGISEADIEEKFIKSSGSGGQNVNKNATCVYLLHQPTGIEVKCQQERSQALNRFFARRLLAEKIATKIAGEKSKKRQAAEKIKRQKRRRSRKAKAKIREEKEKQSVKKAQRKKPQGED